MKRKLNESDRSESRTEHWKNAESRFRGTRTMPYTHWAAGLVTYFVAPALCYMPVEGVSVRVGEHPHEARERPFGLVYWTERVERGRDGEWMNEFEGGCSGTKGIEEERPRCTDRTEKMSRKWWQLRDKSCHQPGMAETLYALCPRGSIPLPGSYHCSRCVTVQDVREQGKRKNDYIYAICSSLPPIHKLHATCGVSFSSTCYWRLVHRPSTRMVFSSLSVSLYNMYCQDLHGHQFLQNTKKKKKR